MAKFVRWLSYVGHWIRKVPVAPYYWCVVAVVMASLVVMWMCGWSEKAFRITGMFLQLGGVLTVVWGIVKTREDFQQPAVKTQFGVWFKQFPQWNPPPIVLSPEGVGLVVSGRAHLVTGSGPSIDRTVDGRLTHLEGIADKLERAHKELEILLLESDEKAKQALDAEVSRFTNLIAGVSKKIETTATGGVHVSAVGVVLLLVGTIFGGAAPELSQWIALLE
ncbi:hypothetical protein [Comamonas sediminis]|uniref:Uncharacterized protein n=1 Tax=Comamonas sediminis TaxID=1783360 RepID=A0ABV4AXK0_9BURK